MKFACAWWIALPMYTQSHARPPVQDADRLLLRLAQHGPSHGFGALFGHGLSMRANSSFVYGKNGFIA
jgi:hypothetical protein